MTKVSPKNFAQAVYEATEGKSGHSLAIAIKRSAQAIKDKRMLGKSKEILSALQNIFDKKTGTIRTKVSTAKNLKKEERNKLEEEIKKKYKAQIIEGEFFENKELLGGMRIETEGEVFDNTYKKKLHELEKFLIQEK
ncbi:MAG: F0F1 ATP synthase subunit delta [Candidatus Paceibacterota bacterium]